MKEKVGLGKGLFMEWKKGRERWEDMMVMRGWGEEIMCKSRLRWWGGWVKGGENKRVMMGEGWLGDWERGEMCGEKWM